MQTSLKSLISKLHETPRHALERAANAALSRGHFEVDIEHVLLELIDTPASDAMAIFKAYSIDTARLQKSLLHSLSSFKTGNTRNPVLATTLPKWLESAWLGASVDYGATRLRSGHLVLALAVDETLRRGMGDAADLLRKLPADELRAQLPAILRASKEGGDIGSAPVEPASEAPVDNQRTPALDKYTIDLTGEARAGKIDAVLGRDAEIRQMIDILLRRRQNNPILTGEPGVGKTAVVEGLALRIAASDVPGPLLNVALRTLDLGLLQAGASVKGEFENRLRGVIDEVKSSLTPIILFIDEAHTMIGAGGQAGQNDAANLLKPALARGELRTIAATTWAEYKKYFEKDAALARRFQVVKIEEPGIESATHMLRGIVGVMEAHHKVRILDEAVVEAVKLSARYISGRQLPDKGVSVLDTACAQVALSLAGRPAPIEDVARLMENLGREQQALTREGSTAQIAARLAEIAVQRSALEQQLQELQKAYEQQRTLVEEIRCLREQLAQSAPKPKGKAAKAGNELEKQLGKALAKLEALHKVQPMVYECVDASAIAEIISSWTGIPLGRMVEDELEAVRKLEALLEARVVGQSHALALIAHRIQIAKANLEDPNKPKGVFLLVGPSGVGKTETALALADTLYGGERNLVSINMSEYQEAHSVSGLKGSPPGYIGYGEGGVLTESVRRKPYCVLLLDEVEKAHPDVLELFFQVFDKGVLEDAEGREVDFKNTVIILTSNVGTDLIMRAAEHGVTVEGKARPATPEDLVELLRDDLQKAFKPAFLGRLTVVPYYPVKDKVLEKIVRLKLEKVRARIQANHGAELAYDNALVRLITERCLDVDSGARNADAVISDSVLMALSNEILARMAAKRPVKSIAMKVKKGELKVEIA
jgi:type VI secretion system protein VasG